MSEPRYSLFDTGVTGTIPPAAGTPQMSDSLGSNPGLLGVLAQPVQSSDRTTVLGAAVAVAPARSGAAVHSQSASRSESISSIPGSLGSVGGIIPAAAPIPGSSSAGSQANLIVNYIPVEINEEEFKQLFAQFGEVESAKIVTERGTGASKGYGFIKFSNPDSAQDAMTKLDGFSLYNKKLKVGLAARQQSHSNENAAGSRIVLGSGTNSQASSMNSSLTGMNLSGSAQGRMMPLGGLVGPQSGSGSSVATTPNGLALTPGVVAAPPYTTGQTGQSTTMLMGATVIPGMQQVQQQQQQPTMVLGAAMPQAGGMMMQHQHPGGMGMVGMVPAGQPAMAEQQPVFLGGAVGSVPPYMQQPQHPTTFMQPQPQQPVVYQQVQMVQQGVQPGMQQQPVAFAPMSGISQHQQQAQMFYQQPPR